MELLNHDKRFEIDNQFAWLITIMLVLTGMLLFRKALSYVYEIAPGAHSTKLSQGK